MDFGSRVGEFLEKWGFLRSVRKNHLIDAKSSIAEFPLSVNFVLLVE